MFLARPLSLLFLSTALLAGRIFADTEGSRLLNLSARGLVGTGDSVLIGGLVIPAGAAKSVLIRAVGPSLGSYGVSSPLANPHIAVLDATGATVASNDDWSASLASTFTLLGAFALDNSSHDAALVATLAPGAYTVVASGVGDTTGVALLEIYETDSTNTLVNLSTRGQVGSGDNVLIAGFVVGAGTAPRRLLLRGVGPRLADYGVSACLSDPQVTLYNAAGTALATNDNWSTPATSNDASASTLSTAFSDAGAFSLNSSSKDSALLVTLAAGSYSMIVSGVEDATGIGLAEIYDVTGATDLPAQTAPALTSQPASASVAAGASASFSVAAAGTAPLTYQWYKDGTALSGATAATYTLSSAATADAGAYSVVVANALGSVTSATATLGVTTTTTGSNTATLVAAAQSYLATLSTTQLASGQLTYSSTNARFWTNLPVGSRNGLKLTSLSTAQLAAATTLVNAALSTTGQKLLEQIRLGDQVIHLTNTSQSWGYDLYYLAIIGTPSITSTWMLQISGHHFAVNITYNGAYVSATPMFDGTEPPYWTDASGTYHAPLDAQRLAVSNLAIALQADSTVASTAKLSGTFTDIVMGATGSGDTNYPLTYPSGSSGRGVSYAALSSAQKLLVKAAIEAWVDTQASDVAAALLAAYESDSALASTYIGYGAGTGGTADFTAQPSGLATQHSYLRIDGPRVWIEFVVQQGVAYSTQVHYHTVWRDKLADYGGNF